jgi:hypothetical protein
VRNHYPDADISVDGQRLTAKYGTMIFTIHRDWKTGEILKETDQVEGPNFRGFILSITVAPGQYDGQAVVPQTLDERYWHTYIDRPPTEDGKGYYVINFSYGSKTDRDFMNGVFELLPRTKR